MVPWGLNVTKFHCYCSPRQVGELVSFSVWQSALSINYTLEKQPSHPLNDLNICINFIGLKAEVRGYPVWTIQLNSSSPPPSATTLRNLQREQ